MLIDLENQLQAARLERDLELYHEREHKHNNWQKSGSTLSSKDSHDKKEVIYVH